jgi:hypothetical protein
MIKEFEFFHGTIFTKLIHEAKIPLTFETYPTPDNASYILNGKTGIYIKYSTKRLSPWRFSFQKRHQDEMLEMRNKYGEVYLLLVCNDGGIVALSSKDLKEILNETFKPIEWISVARMHRKMYTVKGSDGDLGYKIALADFPKNVINSLTEKRVPGKGLFSWFKRSTENEEVAVPAIQ